MNLSPNKLFFKKVAQSATENLENLTENLLYYIYIYGLTPPVLNSFGFELGGDFIKFLSISQTLLFFQSDGTRHYIKVYEECPEFWSRLHLILSRIGTFDVKAFYAQQYIPDLSFGYKTYQKLFTPGNIETIRMCLKEKHRIFFEFFKFPYKKEYKKIIDIFTRTGPNYSSYVYPSVPEGMKFFIQCEKGELKTEFKAHF